MLADTCQIHEAVDGSQQVILRDMILYRELVKQCVLRLLSWSQRRRSPRFTNESESATKPQINKSFSTEYAHHVSDFAPLPAHPISLTSPSNCAMTPSTSATFWSLDKRSGQR
ncbi:hypothetical protein AQS8620_03381 [Aquimixticola soesokkakensis]|uniref:Uncharacterized protein n=1 Tax=Aquimixticola soesokkakensis TaxID=1519096 RepID=A0A1Y5TSM9_9RHOB|nr:hypothetical protein AQS8620_03381 [Aquimixticola soesokkakensis]